MFHFDIFPDPRPHPKATALKIKLFPKQRWLKLNPGHKCKFELLLQMKYSCYGS